MSDFGLATEEMKRFVSLILSVCLCVLPCFSVSITAQNNVVKTNIPAILNIEVEKVSDFENTSDDVADLSGEESAELFGIFDDGDGSVENPYVISDSFQLEYMRDNINSGKMTKNSFVLANDIDLGGMEWTPIGYYSDSTLYNRCFSGNFNGNGYKIYNFKITKATTKYIGLFGFVYNGSIENLKVSDFDISVNSNDYIYVGALVGRCISSGYKNNVSINNCHAKDGFINSTSTSSSYAGGLLGYFMASGNADAYLSNSTASVPVYSKTNATANDSAFGAYAGGLCGYLASDSGMKMTIQNCNATENVSAFSENAGQNKAFAGGFCGFSGVNGAESDYSISGCFATGNAKSEGNYPSYSGGFSSYFSVSNGTFQVSDCYASGNSTSQVFTQTGDYNYSGVGGFAGQGFDSTGKAKFSKCYCLGDAVDTQSKVSYVGAFEGYVSGFVFENCYYDESANVVGTDISKSKAAALSQNQLNSKDAFSGFDFENVWTIDENSDYSKPTLKNNAHKEKQIIFVTLVTQGGNSDTVYVKKGEAISPVTPPDITDEINIYEFSHWSLTQDGEIAGEEQMIAKEDITLYAVYNVSTRLYTVRFISDGKDFIQPMQLEYMDEIFAPAENPEKDKDTNFRYVFSHWSLSEDGEAVDFSNMSVNDDIVFYAVFKAYDADAWDGFSYSEFTFGSGTQFDPYLINDAFQFYNMAKKVNSGDEHYRGAYYKLCSDINLGDNEWIPIGTQASAFEGHFNGQGYIVSKFKITKAQKYSGLFGNVKNASISSLELEDYYFFVDDTAYNDEIYAGTLVGYALSDGENAVIERISTSGNVYVNADLAKVYASGLAGYINSKDAQFYIKDVKTTGNVYASSETSSAYAGGICAFSMSQSGGISVIETSFATGNIEAYASKHAYAGGICANESVMQDEYSDWMSEEASLFAEKKIVIKNSFATGNVTASAQNLALAGAIVGEISSFADTVNCYYNNASQVKAEQNGEIVNATVVGISAGTSILRSESFVRDNIGFDVGSVWEFDKEYSYPSLIVVNTEKSGFKITNIAHFGTNVSAEISVNAPETLFAVTVTVYNTRGKMVSVKTYVNENIEVANYEFYTTHFVGGEDISHIKVSVTDRRTMMPIFPSQTRIV